MNRRAMLQASAAASPTPLAGCSMLDGLSRGEETDTSPASKASSSLVDVTFFLTGTAKRADGTYFYLDPSQYSDKVVKINVTDNSGPLVGTETDDGDWIYERKLGWESVPQGAEVVASVQKTDQGELKAVKILFHAIASFERPPQS